MPWFITNLQEFDDENGTDYVEIAKAMLWRYANEVVNFDGKSTVEEKAALQRWEVILFGAGGRAPAFAQRKSVPRSLTGNSLMQQIQKTVDELAQPYELVLDLEFNL